MKYQHFHWVFLLLLSSQLSLAQCTGAGTIDLDFSNALFLDPDEDGDIVASGAEFSSCSNDILEFESLTNPLGCSDCQIEWTPIGETEEGDELWKGTGGTVTDIVSDEDGGSDFMYFSIIDPDGLCNSGDEKIALRLRLAKDFSGNYGFSFFISNDGLVGESDPDGIICNKKYVNPGFEYEVQIATQGASQGVNIFDINGKADEDNCPGKNPCTFYELDTNVQIAKTCGSSWACRSATPAGDPIFLTTYFLLSDIGMNCTDIDLLSIVPVTSNSGNNKVGIESNKVADIGGVGSDKGYTSDCPSCNNSSTNSCDKSLLDLTCALICAAEKNMITNPLPVELTRFTGAAEYAINYLNWETASEANTEWFIIERSSNGKDAWSEIGRKQAAGNTQNAISYLFMDDNPLPESFYRLQIIDFDGYTEYSKIISLFQEDLGFKIAGVYPNPAVDIIQMETLAPKDQAAQLQIIDMQGRIIQYLQVELNKGQNINRIDVSTLPNGVYALQLISGSIRVQTNMVKIGS